jgi:sugar lactone lactonase YvrE
VSGEIVIGSSNTGRLRAIASDGSAISTIAGALPGSRPAGLLATSTPLEPAGLALAPDGAGVLIAEPAANRISRVSLDDGLIETVIGSGAAASSGDGGPAALAEVSGPSDVMVAPDGTIYVVERGGARVRRVDAATGEISTVAGTGTHGFGGDGGPATAAQLSLPVRGRARGGRRVADLRSWQPPRPPGSTRRPTSSPRWRAMAWRPTPATAVRRWRRACAARVGWPSPATAAS